MRFLKIRYRLAAYSIIEVIVALVILLFLFFIAIEFFTNVDKAGFNIQKINASNALDTYIFITDSTGDYVTEKNVINGWMVSREVQPYGMADSLVRVQYTVYRKDPALSPLIVKDLILSTRK
ncbi:type II secretion system protein [Niabella aquatica]